MMIRNISLLLLIFVILLSCDEEEAPNNIIYQSDRDDFEAWTAAPFPSSVYEYISNGGFVLIKNETLFDNTTRPHFSRRFPLGDLNEKSELIMSYKLTIQNAQLFENAILPGTTVQLYQQVNDDLQLVASESEVPSAITTDINGVYDIEQIYRLDLATANVLELFLHGGRNFTGQVFFQDLVVTTR